MSEQSDVYEAAHTWIRTYADPAGGTLATDKVIPANDAGGRPMLPYAAVLLSPHGAPDRHDETLHSLDMSDDPQYEIRGVRGGTIVLHTYGAGTELWLENLVWSLKREDVQLLNHDAGFTPLAPTQGIRTMPQMRNANREPHFVLEFPYTYRVTSGMIPATAADTVEVDATLYAVDPAVEALVVDIDTDIS